jgi:hypothetical protein
MLPRCSVDCRAFDPRARRLCRPANRCASEALNSRRCVRQEAHEVGNPYRFNFGTATSSRMIRLSLAGRSRCLAQVPHRLVELAALNLAQPVYLLHLFFSRRDTLPEATGFPQGRHVQSALYAHAQERDEIRSVPEADCLPLQEYAPQARAGCNEAALWMPGEKRSRALMSARPLRAGERPIQSLPKRLSQVGGVVDDSDKTRRNLVVFSSAVILLWFFDLLLQRSQKNN